MKKTKLNLPKEVRELLTEETITVLEKAIEDKVELVKRAELAKQDDFFSEKLETLLEQLDELNAKKLYKAVGHVRKAYRNESNKGRRALASKIRKDSERFKEVLVESVALYLDKFLDKAIPKEDIYSAVRNKTAYNVLEHLREALAVDSTMMNESIREGVVDAKETINNLKNKLSQVTENVDALMHENDKLKVQILLTEKTADLPEKKKKFVNQALADKPYEFVVENFEYTVELFNENKEKRRSLMTEEVLKSRKQRPDTPANKPAKQSRIESYVEGYLPQLKRGRY